MSTAYWELPGLEQVYLEESWVLGIEVDQQLAAFQLELVLTEDHPRYQPPRPGEQYCYAPARLVFECAELVELQLSGAPPATDASVNSDGRVPTGSCGSGAATAGLVELTAVTLGARPGRPARPGTVSSPAAPPTASGRSSCRPCPDGDTGSGTLPDKWAGRPALAGCVNAFTQLRMFKRAYLGWRRWPGLRRGAVASLAGPRLPG